MTAQDVFDKVARGIIAQGRPSIIHYPAGNWQCRYRTPDGCKCAAGQLIADEHYTPGLEGYGVGDQSVNEALLRSGVDSNILGKLLGQLQSAHDAAALNLNGFFPSWREHMTTIASEHGLDATVLDEVP